MEARIDRANIAEFISSYSKRNQGREVTTEVLGDLGAQESSHGLKFNGLALTAIVGSDNFAIELMLGSTTAGDTKHLSHTVSNVSAVFQKQADDGRDDALEIEDKQGVKTLLRFI